MLSYPLTDEIELRMWMPHHAEALMEAIQLNAEHIHPFLEFATPEYSLEMAEDFIRRSRENMVKHQVGSYGFFYGDQVVGGTGYVYWDEHNKRTEIGYWLAKAWTGQGLMTKAVQVLTDYALGTRGMNRVEIQMDVRNAPSAGVPKRLGFKHEHVRRNYLPHHDELHDSDVYVMLAKDWHDPDNPYKLDIEGEFLRYQIADDFYLALQSYHHDEAIAELIQQDYDYLAPWLPFVKPDYSVEDAHQITTRYLSKFADNNGMWVALIYNGEFAGSCGYLYWNMYAKRTEIGYWIGEKFQGKGLVTRAVEALTDYAIHTLGMYRLDIITDVANEVSGRVALRLGYTLEGQHRQYFAKPDGQHIDAAVYTMFAPTWEIRTQETKGS